MNGLFPVQVLGTGAYQPRQAVTSASLDARYERPAGFTERLSGVRQRHFADATETTSYMAAEALRQALAAAHLPARQLDLLLSANAIPEQPMPATAVLLHRALAMRPEATCFDVNGACLSFVHALETASLGIAAGRYRYVAIVSAEVASKGLNWGHAESSSLFGDGAGAVVLGPAAAGGAGVLAFGFETHSQGAALCEIPAGGTRYNPVTPPPDPTDYLFRMDGPGVYRLAAQVLPPFLDRLLAQAGCGRAAIHCVIPHQASYLGLRLLTQRLGFAESQLVQILPTHGNQVAASIPSALHAAVQGGQLQRGQLALLLGTAAGLTLGGAVLRY